MRPIHGAPWGKWWERAPGIAAVVLVAAALMFPGPAAADRMWCRTDPVVAIGGQVADVFTLAPLNAPLLVTGPTQIVITVPPGVSAWLVASDLGFGKGETVSFAESAALKATPTGIQVRIAVYVPATDSTMPVRVEFAPRIIGLLQPVAADGTANGWVLLTTAV